MTQVESRLKPDGYGPCECGSDDCTLDGRLGRADRDGRRHVTGCACKRCTGRRSNRKGNEKGRKAQKALGIGGVNSRHEELWGGPVRTEAKSGAKAKPVATAYERERAQSEAARSIGDNRPFVASYLPDGSRHIYFVIRDDDLEQAVVGLGESLGVIA